MDVKEALEKAEQAKSYWSEIYSEAENDLLFGIGIGHYSDREMRDRPDGCMVVPVLPQFIHQVVNDGRQNTPSINVLPGEGEGSSIETAKIFKGLIRNIEYKSNADEVYDTGLEYAVRSSFGFARVEHDYIDDSSDLQELKLLSVPNPQGTYLDPSYIKADGSDAEWGFALEQISKKAFEKKYPGKEFTSFSENPTDSKAEEITLAEFFYKELVKVEGRKRPKTVIHRCRFSGADRLEETTFPGIYIPIVPFLGEVVWINGKRYLLSLIRNAKDAQRRINKWATKESELLDMAPIAPILAPVGAIENVPDGWTAPDDTIVLRYNMFDSQGRPLDKPERLNAPQIPTGFVNAMQAANEQVKQAMGMYNASIGQRSNETSGVAIDARKVEGEVATFHFADNRNRSIQHIGRILVHAIPEIYDTERVIQIVGEEEEPQMVGINGLTVDGQEHKHDLTKGQYDVRVTTGASYTTKRQEAAALLGDLVVKNPSLLNVVGDLLFKNMDVAGADAIASRLKKTIPPQLLDEKDREQEAPDPEKQQMAQIIEQGAAEIQRLTAELANKQGELQLKGAEIELKKGELQVKAAEMQQPQSSALDVESQAFDQHIKQRELELKEAEFELKVFQAKQAPAKGSGTAPAGIKLDTTGFQMLKTPEQEEFDKQAEIERLTLEQQKLRLEQQELALQQQESAQRAEQANAVIMALASISAQLDALNKPKPITVIRDPNTGVITGAV